MNSLKQFTDEQLLAELVSRNEWFPAPSSRHNTRCTEVLIGIGTDHTCYIAIHDQAMAALNSLVHEKSQGNVND